MDVALVPTPLVPWLPVTHDVSRTPRYVRVGGALVGALASGLLAVVLGLPPPMRSGEPFGFEWFFEAGRAFALLGSVMVLPASIGGALVAPAAWRARGIGDWVGIVVQLALAAVFIGTLIFGASFIVGALLAPSGLTSIGPAVVVALLVLVFGLIFVGPFVLPFTAAGAAIWAMGMWLLRHVAGRTSTARCAATQAL